MRIVDYGVTEERYIGVVASLWILAWSLVFAIRRTAGIRWIPASLGVIAIVIAYGPWSAGAVSKRSQLARAIAILQTHGLWTGSEARPAEQMTELPHNEGASLRSTIEYLIHMHGAGSVRTIFASVVPNDKWPKREYWNAGNAIMDALHLAVAQEKTWRDYNPKINEPIDVAGFRRAWPLTSMYGGVDAARNPAKFDDVRIGFDHGVLKIALGDAAPEPVTLDELIARMPPLGRELTDENSRIDFTIGGRAFRLVVQSLQLQERAGKPIVNDIQFWLLER